MVDFNRRVLNALDNHYDEELSSVVHNGENFDPFMDKEEEDDPSHYDVTDIEVQSGQNISEIMRSDLPEYLVQLEKLVCPPEEKVELLSLYEGSIPRPFDKYINRVVTILGAIVWYHPPFQPNVENKNAPKKPGYDMILFLTDEFDEDGLPIVIKGSEGLTNHVRGMLSANGWYIWEAPVRYRLIREGQGKPFKMINQDRVDRMRAEKEARKQK